MARRKNSRGSTPPKYRLHKPSGKAVVSIHGRDHYLGQHGTRESRTKYKLLIADLWAKDEELMPIVPSPFEAVRVGLLAVEFAKGWRARRCFYRAGGLFRCDVSLHNAEVCFDQSWLDRRVLF